jgi:hypothetical protein
MIGERNARARAGTAWATATPTALRVCPFCRAGPNQSCRNWVTGHVKYVEEGGSAGYWKRIASFHPERSGRQPRTPRKKLPPPEAFHNGQ